MAPSLLRKGRPKLLPAEVKTLVLKFYKGNPSSRASLARKLGVSVDALEQLSVGFGSDWQNIPFSSWPSYGADGEWCGIVRRYPDGAKKTLAGTRNGIFAAEGWWKLPGPICIVEGGSDVAALHGAGFPALGRPSNTGGGRILKAFLQRRAVGRVALVIGENDRKPERVGTLKILMTGTFKCPDSCAGCSFCWPGKYGAESVARFLRCRWAMLPKEFKDVRAWANGDPEFATHFKAWLEEVTK